MPDEAISTFCHLVSRMVFERYANPAFFAGCLHLAQRACLHLAQRGETISHPIQSNVDSPLIPNIIADAAIKSSTGTQPARDITTSANLPDAPPPLVPLA